MNSKYLALVTLLVLSSCNNNSDEKRELTAEEKVAQRSWCYANTLADNLNFINKLNFKIDNSNKYYPQNKVTREAIIYTDKLEPTIYPFEGSLSWELGSGGKNWYSGYKVKLVEGLADSFESQEMIINRILNINSEFASSKRITPEVYLQINYKVGLSSKEETLYAFPCEAFSDTVTDFHGRRGNKLEHDLYSSQEIWSWSHKHEDKEYLFERDMPIYFPIEIQKNISLNELQGSAWCSWHQLNDTNLLLELVIFGKSSFSRVTYSDGRFEMFKEEDVLNLYEMKAKDSPVSKIESVENGLIKANTEFQILDLPSSKITSYFYSIKDSLNTPILVSSALGQSAFIFEFLYFPCDDKRALKNSPIFEKHLPRIIEAQKKSLKD